MPAGHQVKGVCDGGGGQGQESHDLCASAGSSLQRSTGFPTPAAQGRGLQSGCRSHTENLSFKKQSEEPGS